MTTDKDAPVRSLPALTMMTLLPLFLLLATLPAGAQQRATWYVLAHADGCLDLNVLMKAEKLPRAPVSPEDFARMMRERGETVAVGPLPDAPAELSGKVVQVKVGESKAPVFVKAEVCRRMGK